MPDTDRDDPAWTGPDRPAPRGPDAARGPDPTPDPTDAAPRAVYRRYRPGEPHPTPLGDCPATAGGYACTRPAGHRAPQHLAGGTSGLVLATWTGDGADLATWDGEPPGTPARLGDPVPASPLLDRLTDDAGELSGALALALSAARVAGVRLVTSLDLLASLDLPRAAVVALPGESAREVATRRGLTLEVLRDDPYRDADPVGYRFFGPAPRVAALLREVAGVRD